MYKKRAGTSGISGQLYETRLVSLILFRLLHDDTVQEFHLASNVDDIGAFDDVCLRAKITGLERPLLVFIQAKHKEDDESYLNYDLIKNFHESLVKVKENFYATKKTNELFKGNFADVDCLFVLYTNGKFYDDSHTVAVDVTADNPTPPLEQTRKPCQSSFAEKVSYLIGTGDGSSHGSQADYTEKDLELASDKILEEELAALAEHFSKFLNDQSMNIMLDKYMVLYHVILAQKVVHISVVKSEEIIKKEKAKKDDQKSKQVSKMKQNQNKDEQTSVLKSQKNKQSENISQNKNSDGNNAARNTKHLSEDVHNEAEQSTKPIKSEQTINNKAKNNKPKETQMHTDISENKAQQFAETKTKATKPTQEKNEKRPEPEVRKYRDLKFRRDFVFTDDKSLVILRDKMIEIVINNQVKNKKKQKTKSKDDASTSSTNDTIEQQISDFLSEPSAYTLSPLIGSCIIYKSDSLKFIFDRPSGDIEKLEQINTSQTSLSSMVDEAEIITAQNILLSLDLKVPATFGNIDMTIQGDSAKVEKRLNSLMEFIDTKLCQKSKTVDLYNIVTIDKSVGEGFLSLTGGIGSAVGNLLVYEKTSKLLKFTENCELLQSNARALYDKLISNQNIASKFKSYRFDTKDLINFPKLELDYTDEAKNILNKVVVYEKQSNHNGVETILRQEIKRHQSTNDKDKFSLEPDKIVIHYHNEIQKWWMSKIGKFYTKATKVYEKAINNIFVEPQISAMQITLYMNNINYFRYDFNKKAMASIASLEKYSRAIIVTDSFKLTTVKVIKYLKSNDKHDYAVLDLECLLYLPTADLTALKLELRDTNKMLILVCDHQKNYRSIHQVLDTLAEVTIDKETIVIVNKSFLKMAHEYFAHVDVVLTDELQSLTDFTLESMTDIIEKSTVIFQGEKVKLNLLVDAKSAGYVKGAVLNKIIHNETVVVGASVSNSNYEEMRHLYVERKVHLAPNENSNVPYDYVADYSQTNKKPKGCFLRRFEDINEDVVLLTAAPGMGKSTLLTHLSIYTKIFNEGLWIVRTNLLDHSKTFHDWQKTDINVVETLKLLCQVILKNNYLQICLKENFEEVYLDGSTGDEMADFELNMFLHFYNERQLLFLFDGFDEICPHYKEKVINLFSVVMNMNYPKKHKMWVTSRPYSEILPDLQRVLGKSYELEYINDTQQEQYLESYWEEHLIIKKLNEVQLRKVTSFIDFMNGRNSPKIARIYHIFYEYVRRYYPHINKHAKLAHLIPMVLNPNLTELNAGLVQRRADIVMGTPLLLYLYANYFVNVICGEEASVNWQINLEDSYLAVFEMFAETNLKILFQDKNEMDIYRPTILTKYLKNYAECLTLHKRLAAYTLFFHRIHIDELKELHPFKEEGEYEAVINEIKCGTEKIGLISHVSADNIAVFVYKTLEEYFANEFLCDIFKNKDIDFAHKNFLYSIAHVTFGIFPWMTRKMHVDTELNRIIRDIEYRRPHNVDIYGYLFATGWPIEQLIRLRSSTADDYEPGCFSDHDADIIKVLRRLDEQARNLKVKEFQVNVIAKMKPHLKQYFTVFPGDVDQKS